MFSVIPPNVLLYKQEATAALKDPLHGLPKLRLDAGTTTTEFVQSVRDQFAAVKTGATPTRLGTVTSHLDALTESLGAVSLIFQDKEEGHQQSLLTPAIVGIAFSYIADTDDKALPAMLEVLSHDSSDNARNIARKLHNCERQQREEEGTRIARIALSEILAKKVPQLNEKELFFLTQVRRHSSYEALQKFTDSAQLEKALLFLATHCKNLHTLVLTGITILTPGCIQALKGFTALETLDLSRTNITDDDVAALKDMPFTRCYLEDTSITGSTLHLLRRDMHTLSLSGCKNITDEGAAGIGRKLDAASKVVHEAMQLKNCCLDSTSITGSILPSLYRGIVNLGLRDCQYLREEVVPHIAAFTQLQFLYLARCKVLTDSGLQQFTALSKLQHLGLSGCPRISVNGIAPFRKPGLNLTI